MCQHAPLWAQETLASHRVLMDMYQQFAGHSFAAQKTLTKRKSLRNC
jgi:hypothetical protein